MLILFNITSSCKSLSKSKIHIFYKILLIFWLFQDYSSSNIINFIVLVHSVLGKLIRSFCTEIKTVLIISAFLIINLLYVGPKTGCLETQFTTFKVFWLWCTCKEKIRNSKHICTNYFAKTYLENPYLLGTL